MWSSGRNEVVGPGTDIAATGTGLPPKIGADPNHPQPVWVRSWSLTAPYSRKTGRNIASAKAASRYEGRAKTADEQVQAVTEKVASSVPKAKLACEYGANGSASHQALRKNSAEPITSKN